jgi:hypothetical protein
MPARAFTRNTFGEHLSPVIESANETNTDVTETISPDNETELDTNAPITSRLPR